MRKRILAVLLCFCLLVGLLPSAAFAAGTDEGAGTGKAIQIGVSQIEGAQVSSIYFGTYPQSSDGRGGYRTDPIKWRVLSNADGKPFLLSDQNLDRRQYNTTNYRGITWEKSTIRSWLNGYGANENSAKEDYSANSFMNTAFSSGEQSAIAQTYVYNKTRSDGSTSPNPRYNPEGGNNTTDKVFLLSLEEVENSSYFPNGNSSRSSANTAYAYYAGVLNYWWLRTPGAANIWSGGGYEDVTNIAFVHNSGNLDYYSRYGEGAKMTYYVRPAVNVNPNNVLFTSAAVGGKADAEVDGDLTAVGTAGTEWKLTLKDDSRSSFQATTETKTIEAGQSLSIRYSGARTGIDEYVSVLLCDSSDNVLYYGRIARNSASGAANITIPHALVTDSYTLKVFSEQYNGNKMTDYASAFVNLPLAVNHTHQYGAGWETDEDKHWHECSCGARNGEADHAYDNEQDASCNICGYVRAFYTLTVDLKGGSGSTASGSYAKGTVIHIDAGTRPEYRFSGWLSSDGGSFADVSSASTTFTMPAADTTITAYWQYTGGAGQTIQIDTGGISGYDRTDGYDYIYFGNWTAKDSYTTSGPIKWRVLDDETNTGSVGLFLLSDALLGTGKSGGVYFQQSCHFDPYIGAWHKGSEPANNNHTNCRIMNAWQGSDAQSWCREFYRSNLTTKEQGAVLATTKSDKEYSDGGSSFAAAENILSDDKVFFLSAEEAANGAYGFTDGAARVVKYGDWRGSWHLRSPYTDGTANTGVVSPNFETMAYNRADSENPARPAFNLDLSAVLFTSAAAGGKEDTAVDGDLAAVGAAGTEWKLTLKDTSRSFTAKTAATAIKTGQSLSVDYSGAQTGSNEYVSAMIADESGAILYYGRIAQNSASGTAIVTIPSGLEKGSYTLKVFSEQYNGDYKTDYASAFVDIVLDIDPGKALQVSADGISGYDNSINGHDYDYIYYGIWDSSPVKWRVLDTKTNRENAAEGDGLFMLSDALLGTGTNGGVCFNNRVSDGNTWQGSATQSWCNAFYSGSLTAQEQDAVLATTKSDKEFRTSISGVTFAASENILNNDRVFFLSAEEAETGAYGFTDGNARIAGYGSGAGAWWLRSPHIDYPDHAGAVSSDGSVNGSYVNFSGAARPAFNLNLDSVLFMSAAAGGKDSTAVDGSLTSVSDYNGSEWKLTLKDSSRNFAITETTAESTNGGTITLNYAGATAGTNEYISAVIEDSNGTQYYGRLKNITVDTEASGTVQLTIPSDLTDGTYTLYVFSEQYNGDYKTDYASALEEIVLTVTEDTIAPKLSDGTVTRDSDTTAAVTFTSDEAGTYYYAVVESGETAPDIDTTGEGTACDTTEQTISLDSLTGADAKDIYIVVKDAAGNVSEKLKITIPAYTEPSYSIAVNPSTLDFLDKTEGYTSVTIWYATIFNTGTRNVIVDLPASENYTITGLEGFAGDTADLAPGGSARFNVTPRNELAAGNYDTTLTISGSNGASASIECYFTVTEAGHIHQFGTDWKADADRHWHVCSCGAKSVDSIARHMYDDEQDMICNVCGYDRGLAPTGEIKIAENGWRTFLNNITFNLFFKNTQTVTITANDNNGETVTIEYLLSKKELTKDELEEMTFTAYSAPFGIDPDNEYVIYAKLSDTSGKVAYINTDGMVFDATVPVISGIENGKTYCAEQTVTITEEYIDILTVNGGAVTLDSNNQFTLNPADETQTVVVTDKAGNETTVSVTVNDGHKLTKTEAKAATCTEEGNTEYWTCENCGKHFSDADGRTEIALADTVIKVTDHKLTKTEAKAATCTEAGNTEYWTCENCGKYFSDAESKTEIALADTVIEATGHKLTKTEAKAATCTEEGNTEYWTCENCGKHFSDADGKTEITLADTVIKATDHKLTKTEAKAATCTEDGNTEYWTCENCGKHFSDAEGKTEITLVDTVIKADGHKLTKTEAKATTCTEVGNTEYWTCENCGKHFSDAEGKTEITLADTVIEATGHKLTKTEAKAATCTEEGNTEYWTCENCGKHFSDAEGKTEITLADTVIKADGHKMTHTPAKAACTEDGNIEYWYCDVCGKYFTDAEGKTEIALSDTVIEATGHKLTKTEAKAATCTEDGNTEYWTCDTCGKYFSDAEGRTEIALADTVIKADGHKLTKTEAKAATCTEEGNAEYWTCDTCGKHFSNAEGKTEITLSDTVIKADGHKMTHTPAKAACTEDGNIEYWYCDVCGKYFSDAEGKTEITLADTVIEADGHKLTKTEAKAATCTEEGNTEYWTCENCGKHFSDAEGKTEITLADTVIEATDHKLTKTEAKVATCTEDGNTEYWTCDTCGKYFSDAEGKTEITLADTVIEADGHKLTHTPAKAACTEDGNIEYWYCDVCGKYFSDAEGKTEITLADTVIEATGHKLTKTEAKAATCIEAGNKEYWTCDTCGKSFEDADCKAEITDLDTWKVIPKLDHTWSSDYLKEHADAEKHYHVCTVCGTRDAGEAHTWNVEAATEETDKHCTVCGYVAEAQLGHVHTLTHIAGKAATCTADGNKEYWTCDICGKFFEDESCKAEIVDLNTWKVIPKLDHTWSADYLKEHADADKHYHVCIVCGTKDAGEAHTWNVEAATEETDKHCTVCGYVAEEKLEPVHTHQGKYIAGKDATCTEDGNKEYYSCSCGRFFEDESCTIEITDLDTWKVIPKLDHTWSTDYLEEHADAEKHYHVCTVCGTKDAGEAHTWNVEAATEETDKHCIVCGYVAEAQLGHVHKLTHTPAKDATCIDEGNNEYWYCETCGKYFRDEELTQEITKKETVIEARGHGKAELKNKKDATCTTEGYTGDKICKDCGEVLEKGEAIPKLAHSYKAGTCTVCGAFDPNYKSADPAGAGSNERSDDAGKGSNSPKTGDNSNIALWIFLMLVAGAALAGTDVYIHKKKRSK